MHRHGALSTPVRAFIRDFGNASSGRTGLPFRSRSERLLVIGCISFAGVAGWNQRRLNHNTGHIEYLPFGRDDQYQQSHKDHGQAQKIDTTAGRTTEHERRAVREVHGDSQQSRGIRVQDHGTGSQTGSRKGRSGDAGDDHDLLPASEGSKAEGGRPGDGRYGASTDTKTGATAEDGSATTVPAQSIIRRMQVSDAKSEHLTRDDLGRIQPRATEGSQTISSATTIEEAVAHAAWRQPDRSHEYRMRSVPSEYPQKYFDEVKDDKRFDVLKRIRRVQIQTERHEYLQGLDGAEWLHDIVEKLEKATPTGAQHYVRKIEVARLPKGVTVLFLGNAGEAVLEIMQRTGCHIQIIAGRRDSGVDLPGGNERAAMSSKGGFSELSLYGTPAENAAALALLPDMVEMVRDGDVHASKDMRDYEVRMDAARDTPATDVVTLDDIRKREEGDDDLMATASARLRGYWLRRKPDIDRVIRPREKDAPDTKVTFIRPKKFSCIALTSYLTDLTAVPAPSISRSHSGPREPGSAHTDSLRQQTIDEIISLFRDPSLSTMISSEAVDLALKLCVRYSDFAALRSIVNALEKVSGYTLTAKNYDIALAAAASRDDVHNFPVLLRTMLRQNIQPSGRTWLSLYRLVCSRFPHSKSPKLVLRFMRAKGILNNVTYMQGAVQTSIKRSLESFIHSGGPDAKIEDFVARMDRKFAMSPDYEPRSTQHITAKTPRPWLSKDAANVIANVLLDRGRTDDALRILPILEDAGQNVGIDTLNTYLTAAKRTRDPSFAIAILRHFEPSLTRQDKMRIKLDGISYSMLFTIAWRTKCLNMLRVIWRYACCAGQVDHDMASRIHDSLVTYLPPNKSNEMKTVHEQKLQDALSDVRGGEQKRLEIKDQLSQELEEERSHRGKMFFALAGKFAIGVANHVRGGKQSQPGSIDGHEDEGRDVFGREIVSAAEHDPIEHMAETAQGQHDHAPAPSVADTTSIATANPIPNSTDLSGWILQPNEEEMLALACQPRTVRKDHLHGFDVDAMIGPQRGDHRYRLFALKSFQDEDMAAPTSYRTFVPLSELLDQAWQKDMRWHERGLGMGGKGGQGKEVRRRLSGRDGGEKEKEKAELWKLVLRAVFEHGVKVPVVVGSGVR